MKIPIRIYISKFEGRCNHYLFGDFRISGEEKQRCDICWFLQPHLTWSKFTWEFDVDSYIELPEDKSGTLQRMYREFEGVYYYTGIELTKPAEIYKPLKPLWKLSKSNYQTKETS